MRWLLIITTNLKLTVTPANLQSTTRGSRCLQAQIKMPDILASIYVTQCSEWSGGTPLSECHVDIFVFSFFTASGSSVHGNLYVISIVISATLILFAYRATRKL